MKLPPDCPISLAAAFALIRATSKIVPAGERAQFEYDWHQNLMHRWQFLRQTDLWNYVEEIKLLAYAWCAVPDSLQHFGAQESVRTRVSRFIQSPFICLGGLFFALILVAACSRGFPATGDLLFKRTDVGPAKLVYSWMHNMRGGGDRPLPADVVERWQKRSNLISKATAFRAVHKDVQAEGGGITRRLVIVTEPSFFEVMCVPKAANDKAASYVVLSYDAWMELFHASPRAKGGKLAVAGRWYHILSVLPPGFEPLSRQSAIYLVQSKYAEDDAYAAIRLKPGVKQPALEKELTDIAEEYYFLNGQIRLGFAQSAIWTPVRSFGFALLASMLMVLLVFRVKWRFSLPPLEHRKAFARRTGFFLVKTTLGLLFVFTICLEWSRSPSAILFGNFDPASGPFLLWLYILGTMAVWFWAVVDQKARCRECLQLLAFPVRMGSPGSLLLDWSGIELCCAQGHGVLHVPHMAPSWAEESEHWIALDDSWQSIFGPEKRN